MPERAPPRNPEEGKTPRERCRAAFWALFREPPPVEKAYGAVRYGPDGKELDSVHLTPGGYWDIRVNGEQKYCIDELFPSLMGSVPEHRQLDVALLYFDALARD